MLHLAVCEALFLQGASSAPEIFGKGESRVVEHGFNVRCSRVSASSDMAQLNVQSDAVGFELLALLLAEFPNVSMWSANYLKTAANISLTLKAICPKPLPISSFPLAYPGIIMRIPSVSGQENGPKLTFEGLVALCAVVVGQFQDTLTDEAVSELVALGTNS